MLSRLLLASANAMLISACTITESTCVLPHCLLSGSLGPCLGPVLLCQQQHFEHRQITLPFATALFDSCRSSSFSSQEESICCQAAQVSRLLPSSFLAAPSSHLHSRLWLSEPLAPWSLRGTVGLMTCRHRCSSSPSARSWLSKEEHNGSQIRSFVDRGLLPGGLSCGPCRENTRKQCQLILTRSRQQGHQGTLQLRKKLKEQEIGKISQWTQGIVALLALPAASSNAFCTSHQRRFS